MAKPQLWQLGFLIFAFIASSRCSIVPKSLECPLQGASFGGRLVLMEGGGLGSGLLPALPHRGRVIIFQTPPPHIRSHMGFGRGQIWIGSSSRTCQGGDSQPGHCPWTGDRPCLDTGIPCITEPPSYNKSSPLEFSEVTEDSITVSWPAWNETTDHGIGPITRHKILYREIDGIFQEIVLDSDRLSHRFDGLTDGTIYQFRIVLIREGEPLEGPPSNIQNVTTLYREPPSYNKSSPLEFSEVTEDSITVSWPAWNETTDHGIGPITRHKILYREIDGIFQEIVLDSDRLSHRFDGLTDGTIYQFRIVLIREGEPLEGPPSNIQNVTTLCRELEYVNLQITELTESENNRFVVSWQLPSLTEHCNITSQSVSLNQLDIDDCNTSPHFEPREYVLPTGRRTKTFRKKLNPNSLYNITYTATNPAGSYVMSQLQRTAKTRPTGAPTNLQHQTTRNRVTFTWDGPPCGDRNGEIGRYELIASKNGEEESGTRRGNLRFILRHLSSGDEWLFKVQACNEEGCGPYAEANGIVP